MNLMKGNIVSRKKLLALAISAATLAPAAIVTADDHIEKDFYASLRLGIGYTDTDNTDDSADVRTLGSKIGFKGQTEFGDGLKAFGRYEYQVTPDEKDTSGDAVRLGFVGIEGNFGKVWLGRDYHNFYNFIVVPADWPWSLSGYSTVLYRGRTDNTLSYFNNIGAIDIGASFVSENDNTEEDHIDETELAVSFDAGVAKFALATVLFEDDNTEDVIALSASGSTSGVSWAINYQQQDEYSGDNDASSIMANVAYSGAYFHFEQLSVDDDLGSTTASIGYTHKVADNTSAWIEYGNVDYEDNNSNADFSNIEVFLKYDI